MKRLWQALASPFHGWAIPDIYLSRRMNGKRCVWVDGYVENKNNTEHKAVQTTFVRTWMAHDKACPVWPESKYVMYQMRLYRIFWLPDVGIKNTLPAPLSRLETRNIETQREKRNDRRSA